MFSLRSRMMSGFAAALAFSAGSIAAMGAMTPMRPGHGGGRRNVHRGVGTGAFPIPGGGARERERRRRQIAAGRITAANGLISWEEAERRGWKQLRLNPDDMPPVIYGDG